MYYIVEDGYVEGYGMIEGPFETKQEALALDGVGSNACIVLLLHKAEAKLLYRWQGSHWPGSHWVRLQNKLIDGDIPPGTSCWHSARCEIKYAVSNGNGCRVCDGKISDRPFSCALARGLELCK